MFVSKGMGSMVDAEAYPRGRSVYGVDIGVIMLDTDFPRPPGDIGHTSTFDFPLLYEVNDGAIPSLVVNHPSQEVLESFLASGKKLVKEGCRTLVTSCGFLSIFQRELAQELDVPVLSSSLLQIPMVDAFLPHDARIGVLTADAAALTPQHLEAVGVSGAMQERLVITGLENAETFSGVIKGKEGPLVVSELEEEIVSSCLDTIRGDHSIRAFVFECTNLPPYAPAVRRKTGLPVWDVVTMTNWLQMGIVQQ